MKLLLESIDELNNDMAIKEYMYNIVNTLEDIMERMGQIAFFVICDKNEDVKVLFFKENYSYDFDIIDNNFNIFLEENKNELSTIYNNIIEQADDYYNFRER